MAFIEPEPHLPRDARKRWRHGIAAGAVALGGCLSAELSTAPHDRSRLVAVKPAAGGVRLALVQETANTDLAALEGVLHVEGACLYVGEPDDAAGSTMLIFSSADVRWDQRTRSLRARGVSTAEGRRVRLTGGIAPDPGSLTWVRRPDASCRIASLFVTGAIEPVAR